MARAWFRVRAHGDAGHSALSLDPSRRAGSVFARALGALADSEPFAAVEHPVDGSRPLVNVATMVQGGISPWQHPEALDATIEIRTVPGMTEQSVLTALRSALAQTGVEERVELTIESWSPPSRPVNDERLLHAVETATVRVLGHAPSPAVFPAFTDAAHLDTAGIPALPAFGPGSMLAIHRPDERAADRGPAPHRAAARRVHPGLSRRRGRRAAQPMKRTAPQ